MIKKTIILICILLNIGLLNGLRPTQDELEYLKKYKYIEDDNTVEGKVHNDEKISKSICKFQKYMNLSLTCEMDVSSKLLMRTPRCGLPDIQLNKTDLYGEYVLHGSKWNKLNLTWKINKYSDNLERKEIDDTIKKAFDMWQNVSALKFEMKTSGEADIYISFHKGEKHYLYPVEMDRPFVNGSTVLAHAFFPYVGGDIHINDYFKFHTTKPLIDDGSVNLLSTVVHELGHTLGLKHESMVSSSIMNPYYSQLDTKLGQDDIDAISTLYGRKNNYKTTLTYYSKLVDFCLNPYIDAILLQNTSTYIFSGNSIKIFEEDTSRIMKRSALFIGTLIENRKIDAVLSVPSGYNWYKTGERVVASPIEPHTIYIFQHEMVHTFNEVGGYFEEIESRKISELFIGIPNNIDASLIYCINKKIIFIKGNEYYRVHYDSVSRVYRIDRNYPKTMSHWSNVPLSLEAAVSLENKNTIFFIHAKSIYIFDLDTWKTYEPFSQSNLLKCNDLEDNSAIEIKHGENLLAYVLARVKHTSKSKADDLFNGATMLRNDDYLRSIILFLSLLCRFMIIFI